MRKSISIFPSRFGFLPYVFLIYMLFPLFSLTNVTGAKQLVGYGMLLLFIVTYRQIYFSIGEKSFTYWLVLQLAIIFIYSVFYDVSYIFLGFFPGNFIGYYREKTKFYGSQIGFVLVLITSFIYHILQYNTLLAASGLFYYVPFLIIMFLSPYGVRSMINKMELEQKLDQANQHIAELVKREERVRIARDLHDNLGHTLSLLTLKSQLVQRLVTVDSERAQLEAKEMEKTSRAALKQVRALVSDMRTITIAEELIQVQQLLKAAEITYQYDGDVDFSQIPLITQNIVSMCIREGATNVARHSRAAHCAISISHSSEKMNIILQDDGMGFDKGKLFGNGLQGIEERLALIDGTLELFTHNGGVVKMTVPIIKKVEQRESVI